MENVLSVCVIVSLCRFLIGMPYIEIISMRECAFYLNNVEIDCRLVVYMDIDCYVVCMVV